MTMIKTNPQADADSGFEIAQPGTYLLRIEGSPNFPAVSEFDSKSTPGNRGLKIRYVFAEPSSVINEHGQPARNVGSIIDQSCLIFPEEKQGKLRSLVESAGMPWSDFETTDLIGREVLCKVGIDEYKGNKKNVIERYLKRA